MSKIENFLSKKEEEDIVEAIRQAEEKTSGEIRVHIEKQCEIDIEERTKAVFHYLKMDNTKEQNGVLIYLAVENRAFAIYGDKGINDVVDDNFWNATKDKIETQFKQGYFKQGLIDGILSSGEALSKHFPWQHGDKNELDNTISKG